MKAKVKLTILLGLAMLCSGVAIAQHPAGKPSNKQSTTVTNWSQYGFLANHTSFNNFERSLTRANVSSLTWQWAGAVGTSAPSSPVVGQGMVYVTASGTIFAFQASDGTPVWSHLSCSGVGTVQAALGAQALLVGDGGGDLAAYDPASGSQLWCDDEGGSITSAPATDTNNVYITNGSSVVAADQATGTLQWSFTPADNSPVTNTPAILNGVVYATGGSSVFALAGSTGQLMWRTDLPPQVNISAPAVAGGTVYIGGINLYALRASDGSILWTQTGVGTNVSVPAIAYNTVFVNSQDALFGLWAFNANTGAFLWRNRMPEESLATPTVANGVVYDVAEAGGLAGNGGVLMFNSNTGAFLGSIVDPNGHPLNAFFRSQPVVVNGTLYVSTEDFSGSNQVDAFRVH